MCLIVNLRLFQLVDLQVFAVPRVTLKPLVPTFPCFSNVVVSLMEKVPIIISAVTPFLSICFIGFVYMI